MSRYTRYVLRVLSLAALLLATTPVTHAATTYYLSPDGNDGRAGTSDSPWQHFSFALPKLHAGDTLILKDGIYTGGRTGYINLKCNGRDSNGSDGSEGAVITVKAEHERQAFLQGDGSAIPLLVRNCRWWAFEGLRVEDGDFQGGGYAGNSYGG